MSPSLATNQTDTTPLLFLEEFNHRAVNHFASAAASMRLARAAIASPEARSALDAAADRLSDYAAAHRALQLPVEHGSIDLAHYLERLCAALSAAHLRERGIILSLSAEPVFLEAARCWRTALIVSELINNAARHAVGGGGTILVLVRDLGSSISCRVADNGGIAHHPSPGRGTYVVRALASDLDGNVQWTFGDNGTRAELHFPKVVTACPTLVSERVNGSGSTL